MENKAKSDITNIERVLTGKKLTREQLATLVLFDRFNELEARCSLRTRAAYLQSLADLGVNVKKPFEEMTKEDLQNYFAEETKTKAT